MKKNKKPVLLTAALFALLFISCGENLPKFDLIRVDSIQLDEDLKNGATLDMTLTMEVAGKVTVVPIEATEKMESFTSSNTEVATVDEAGIITAIEEGTTEITITVDEKTDKFTLTVTRPVINQITIAQETLKTQVTRKVNLSELISFFPAHAINKTLIYTSSDESVLTVDNMGIAKGLKVGKSQITIASEEAPSIKVNLDVTVDPFSGDYPREGWTMAASHPLFKSKDDAEKNSLASALDGDLNTNFCLTRPGKTLGEEPNKVSVPAEDIIYFIVDMKESLDVNYFRMRYRNNKDAFLRFVKFDEISGSNDGETFTSIAKNFTVTDASVASKEESPDLKLPDCKYRYLKFAAGNKECFASNGSSVQIKEFYVGRK